jgi:D-psicose/D-tagatose/L-ribulose 3-epimerase
LIDPKTFEAAALRRALEQNGLACTVCSVLPRNASLISPDASERARARTFLSEAVKGTAEAGAQVIAGPLYSPVGYLPGTRRTEDEWKRAVEGWQELGPTLDSYQVDVALEPLNRFETYFLNLSEDAARLCDQINHPRVGILWDTFHANIEEKHLPESLLATGKHLKHVHTCENDRGIPGTGHVDWSGVFDALRRMHYDNWLTIESFGFHIDALRAAAAIWRDLAPAAEDIAWQGVAFLKQNTTNMKAS